MEEKERRGRILKPLKHYDDKKNKNIVLNLNWMELFFNFIMLILLVCLELFSNFIVLDKIIIFCIILFVLLSLDIKVNQKNIYSFIFSKINIFLKNQDYKNADFIKAQLMEFKDNMVIFNNQEWFIKKIMLINKVKDNNDLIQKWLNVSTRLNCFILLINEKYPIQNYINDLEQNSLENSFINDHKDSVQKLNNTTLQKNLYLFYKNEADIESIKNIGLFNFLSISETDIQIIESKLTKYTKFKIKSKYIFQDEQTNNSIMTINELNETNNISWLFDLLLINIECECLVRINNLANNYAIKLLQMIKKPEMNFNKTKRQETIIANQLIDEYKKEILYENNSLFEIQITYFLHDEEEINLLNKIKTLKENLAKNKINADLIMTNFIDFFNFSFYEKQTSYFGTYIDKQQLIVGLISDYQETYDKNGILIGKTEFNTPFFYNQAAYLQNNDNELLNGISLIIGKSGSGKSVLLKKIILLSTMLKKQKIIILDVDNEFSSLKWNIENTKIFGTLPVEIDPFSLEFDTKQERILFLNSFLNCFSKQEIDFSAEIIEFLDKEKNNFWNFVNFLRQEKKEKAQYIGILMNELYHDWFNKPCKKLDESNLIIFNFKELFDNEIIIKNDFIKASLVLIFSLINNLIFKKRDFTIHLIVEEAYKFFNMEISVLSNIWFSIIKKSRKYHTLLTFCTQNYNDLLISEYSQRIVQNAQFMFIGKLNSLDILKLTLDLKLNDAEKNEFETKMNNLSKAEFLYTSNNKYFLTIKNEITLEMLKKYYEKKNTEN